MKPGERQRIEQRRENRLCLLLALAISLVLVVVGFSVFISTPIVVEVKTEKRIATGLRSAPLVYPGDSMRPAK